MNEHDFDDDLKQLLVCSYGVDCARATKALYGESTAIYDAIKVVRNQQNLNRQLYVIRTGCQGWCQYAPVCTVLPGGKVYKDIRPEEAKAFVDAVHQGEEGAFEARRIWDFEKSRVENQRHLKGK